MKPTIQTYTGREVSPLALTPDDICIEDIAHALALKCRFTGHTLGFYSIAQHSMVTVQAMEHLAGRPLTQAEKLAGLLHDASEAYFPDFAKPIKGCFIVVTPDGRMVPFRDIELVTMGVIGRVFGLRVADFESPLLKRADYAMLRVEQLCLMRPVTWWSLPDAEPLPFGVIPLGWEEAEALFLATYRSYVDELGRWNETAAGASADAEVRP